MEASASRGNNPELWNRLLQVLDERLQLGLLGRLRTIASYHFEDKTLWVEPGSPEDQKYLGKDAVLQQLQVFAQDATKVEKVSISKPKTTTGTP